MFLNKTILFYIAYQISVMEKIYAYGRPQDGK